MGGRPSPRPRRAGRRIVLIDTAAQTRRVLAGMAAAEGNPRWTKNETHVTFTRENSLYLLSLTAQGTASSSSPTPARAVPIEGRPPASSSSG